MTRSMVTLAGILADAHKVPCHRPWPRFVVTKKTWRLAIQELVEARATLIGLWGDSRAVNLALIEEPSWDIAVLTLKCRDGKYPSVGAAHPPAIRMERAIHDLYGLIPVDLPDTRPWLDHGVWRVKHPLGSRQPPADSASAYDFLPAEGEGLHQIPVGPVHAGIIEPGHFRFTANGETVVRLEERLGYAHKGIESLMAGSTSEKGAQLAGRTSGDSTVAYALAFAHAVESALQIEVPPRAIWLRALMAELERVANHLGDIGAICNDASFSLLHAQFGILRERALRAALGCFGHRLMMDRVVPGGVTEDMSADGLESVRGLLENVRHRFPELIEIYDNTASLQDRTVGTGHLTPSLAREFGAGGYVGRASGRPFDARKAIAYSPYDALKFEVPVRDDGDVNARVWLRIREVEQSLKLIDQILERMPEGKLRAEFDKPNEVREGLGLVEGFRGDVLVSIRLGEGGLIERCHLRDPSWFQWPLLEAAIEGNIVADFPLCNKSFNCSYSGHDL
jgi:Ni,Fe-hydrogenase III large subunit/Ni,Fe-hydrogenase III component G